MIVAILAGLLRTLRCKVSGGHWDVPGPAGWVEEIYVATTLCARCGRAA